jgi:probable HAF family extracellular repeat protein
MYTVTDLGAFDGSWSEATGLNASGQVVGNTTAAQWPTYHAFRTGPNRAIDPTTDDVATTYCNPITFPQAYCLGSVTAFGISDTGQVVGRLHDSFASDDLAFRTGPNATIQTTADWLLPNDTGAMAINASGQVVVEHGSFEAFRLTPHTTGEAFNDYLRENLGTLAAGGFDGLHGRTDAYGINNLGQVVGGSDTGAGGDYSSTFHAFRTRPNKAINPATDDLGTLGGSISYGYSVNVFGQVAGTATTSGDAASHAFRTAPNRRISAAKDDLGTLGGGYSAATSINNFGETVGWASLAGDSVQHAFIYSSGGMQDLNNLVVPSAGCELVGATRNSPDINGAGQIAVNRTCNAQQHAVLLTPIYRAVVQPPIDPDGSSVFSAKRGVIPVKFKLLAQGVKTCALPPATIAITKASRRTLALVSESTYASEGVSQPDCQIEPSECRYKYLLSASQLGAGTYRVDLSINGIMVGHAVFTLR